jgi:hypothetical protein
MSEFVLKFVPFLEKEEIIEIPKALLLGQETHKANKRNKGRSNATQPEFNYEETSDPE